MNTPNETLTPNHPAVEAAARMIYVHDAPRHDPQTWPPTPDALADDYRGAALAAIEAALPHLTAATVENLDRLRNTPVGRALKAAAWERGWADRRQYDQDIDWRTIPTTDTNPYRPAS